MRSPNVAQSPVTAPGSGGRAKRALRAMAAHALVVVLTACGAADPEAPPEGQAPASATGATVTGTAAAAGGTNAGTAAGGTNAGAATSGANAGTAAGGTNVGTATSGADAQKGAALYAKYCALCHGARAEGYAADNAPSLRTTTFLSTATDAFLRSSIVYGRPGTAMAGYGRAVGGPLDPPDVDAVIAFVRDGAAAPVSPPPDPAAGDPVKGKAIYDRDCASCHGTATQRADAVHLANPQLLATASAGFLRYAVEHGRPGTRMEAWAGKLSAQQIDDVVAYVRAMAPGAAPTPPTATPEMAPVPPWGPIVINPKGKAPKFDLRDGRYAPVEQVAKAMKEGRRMIIVDARAPSDWMKLHIKGSLPLPYYQLDLIDRLPKDGTWVIAYCACPHHASGVVVDELKRRGFENAAVLDEGVYVWQRAGHPVVAAPGFEAAPAAPPHGHHGHDHHGHDHHGHFHPPH